LTYVWKRDGVPIDVPEPNKYTLTADDLGKRITVEVTGSRTSHATVTRASAATAVVTALTFTTAPVPTISGIARFGETLSVNPGTWAPAGDLQFTWKRDGVAIEGADQSTYVLTAQDVGKRITVETTARNSGYTTITKQSAPSAVVAPQTFTSLPTPIITVIEGSTESSGSILGVDDAENDFWNPSADVVTYSWRYLGSSTVLGTGPTYELTDTDVGRAITVTITGSREGYQTRSIRSSPTSVIRAMSAN
jgi:hypothetical protein